LLVVQIGPKIKERFRQKDNKVSDNDLKPEPCALSVPTLGVSDEYVCGGYFRK
jgi:hypothetical protein